MFFCQLVFLARFTFKSAWILFRKKLRGDGSEAEFGMIKNITEK